MAKFFYQNYTTYQTQNEQAKYHRILKPLTRLSFVGLFQLFAIPFLAF